MTGAMPIDWPFDELPRGVRRDHQLHEVDAEVALAAEQVVRPDRMALPELAVHALAFEICPPA